MLLGGEEFCTASVEFQASERRKEVSSKECTYRFLDHNACFLSSGRTTVLIHPLEFMAPVNCHGKCMCRRISGYRDIGFKSLKAAVDGEFELREFGLVPFRD